MSQRWAYLVALVLVGIGWGSTQPLGKIAASGGKGPYALILGQLVVCVVVLGAIALVRRKGLVWTRAALQFYLVVAVLGTLVPNATFYISVARLPAGIMSILISTVPLMAFPLSLALGIDRFEGKRVVGLALGLLGVALIAVPSTGLPDPSMAAFIPLALIGPLFYAMEGTYVARFGTAGMDPLQAMFGASVAGLVLCVPLTWASGQWTNPFAPWGTPTMALIGSSMLHALLYSAYVAIAARAGAVFATQSAYIVTLAGLCWAMALLGEQFSAWVWAAMVVMMAGMAMVQPRLRAKV